VYFRKYTYIRTESQRIIADLKYNYADLCAIQIGYK